MELQRRKSARPRLGHDLFIPDRASAQRRRGFGVSQPSVCQVDAELQLVVEGGFCGMDNIGVFERSAPLPTGGHLEQADGTEWVSLFCQNMLEISIELAANDPFFEDMAIKFADHFLWIAHAMNHMGPGG